MFSKNLIHSFLLFLLFSNLSGLSAQTVFRGKILDETTQTPIAGAKIGINDQGVGVVTTTNGNFNYRKYHKTISNASVLTITAPGYIPIEINQWDIRRLFNISSKIVMAPKESGTIDKNAVINEVKVFWDRSLSAARADFDKEWGFLISYLQTQPDASVHFIAFSDKVLLEETFTASSNLDALKEKLIAISPTGATDFSLLEIHNDVDRVVLITDGDGVLGEIQPDRDTPIYAITSVVRADHEYLKSLAAFTSGSYINLSESTYAQGLAQIASGDTYQSNISQISETLKGTVVNGVTPVQGASLFIKGDLEEFKTDSDGTFSIPATVGDVIQVNHFGMYPKEMSITSLEPLEVTLKTLDELLDEVVIKGKKRVKDENKADTGFGERSKDVVASNVNTLLGSEISTSAQSIQDALRGRFAGVLIDGFGQDAEILIRGGNSSIPPVWVVDGALFQETPNFIDPQTIANVSIVKSVIAASRYGSIASGGAIIVNTKTYALKQGDVFVDQALIKNNDYKENLDILNLDNLVPDYVKQLKNLPNVDEQFKRYEALSFANQSNASFFIDMALFFQEIDREKAAPIRTRLIEMAQKNGQVLRVVAYLHDAAGDTATSLKLYERIAQLIPREAQSYRDLAKAYSENGYHDRALELYINMLGEQILGVNFKDIDIILSHELLNLTARHGDRLDMSRLPNDYKGTNFGLDLRMTLEYSNRVAPFEFQFVSPANKFYKFNHTLLDNKERLEAEEKNGFQIEEFVVDDAAHGLWKVNLEYLGEKTTELLPNYIKYTIYWGYGTSNQRQEVIVLKLTPDIKKGQFYEFLL